MEGEGRTSKKSKVKSKIGFFIRLGNYPSLLSKQYP
jgi:hypothetical protein